MKEMSRFKRVLHAARRGGKYTAYYAAEGASYAKGSIKAAGQKYGPVVRRAAKRYGPKVRRAAVGASLTIGNAARRGASHARREYASYQARQRAELERRKKRAASARKAARTRRKRYGAPKKRKRTTRRKTHRRSNDWSFGW